MSVNNIKLNEILQIEDADIDKYYVHLACANNEGVQPLNIFLHNGNIDDWQIHRGGKRKFGYRKHIISFVNVYYEGNDVHLFAGIYEITKEHVDEDYYEVKRLEIFQPLIGRLKIRYNKGGGPKFIFYFRNTIEDGIHVVEILKDKLEGRVFEGLDKINLKFTDLEVIVKKEVKDWQFRLNNLKGVYLLIDDSNNKAYVGSAYGDSGVWKRWSDYVYSHTGWSDKLSKLYAKEGAEYFRKNFRFTLLETFTNKAITTEHIIYRENFWKDVLGTRKFGYNSN